MSDFVRASHPVFGTLEIPAAWLTTYPGTWTLLAPDDPGTGPDPLSMYVRDVDLPSQMAAVAADAGSAFSVTQRAASVTAVREAGFIASADGSALELSVDSITGDLVLSTAL